MKINRREFHAPGQSEELTHKREIKHTKQAGERKQHYELFSWLTECIFRREQRPVTYVSSTHVIIIYVMTIHTFII